MSVDLATVKRVAHLARIAVPEDDLPTLQGELNAILGFVEQLAEVDVTDVPPMTAVVAQRLRMREDVVTEGDQAAAVLGNAPSADEDYFVVPKVVE